MPKPTDVNMYFGTHPPCLIPISDRAKAKIPLEKGIDGILVLGDPEMALAPIPDDFMMATTEEPPEVIAIVTKLNVLH